MTRRRGSLALPALPRALVLIQLVGAGLHKLYGRGMLRAWRGGTVGQAGR